MKKNMKRLTILREMRHLFATILLSFLAMAGFAQKTVVWEKPSALKGASNVDLEITKVELKQAETVLHVHAEFTPHYWIRFVKQSFLRTPDGKEYVITSGARTCEKEMDYVPDSLFWIPDSGEADLALHFKPVPLNTKSMDFIEGYDEGAFRFWNICDAKTRVKLEWPDDWKDVKYAKDEVLPPAKIDKGVATVNVKILGYKPDMKLNFHVGGFMPLGSMEPFNKNYPFADDGTLKAEIPLWLVREVRVGIEGMEFPHIVIAPGKETSILMKVTGDHHPFLAFKGFLAKTNMDLVEAYEKDQDSNANEQLYNGIIQCNTPEERLTFLQHTLQKRFADINATKYTSAAKDLLCMEAEFEHLEWNIAFADLFTDLQMKLGKADIHSNDDLVNLYRKNRQQLTLPKEEQEYSFQYLNRNTSPCYEQFLYMPRRILDKAAKQLDAYSLDLLNVSYLIRGGENIPDREQILAEVKNKDAKDVVREYEAEQQGIARQLANQESIFFKKYDDVAPEDILNTILGKYKGEAVLIDIWATWCGPCRAGHAAMAPLKEELKDKDIKFVYITSPSSPLPTWKEMIGNIPGEHYYLTVEQYNYILNQYESNGIPTYAIYDGQGELTYKCIGFPGLDKIKEGIEKAIK